MPSSPSSTPRHIAFILVTSQSHLYPSLALIRELVDRGHRVSVAVGDSQHELFGSTGAEMVGHPSTFPGAGPAGQDAKFKVPKDAGEAMLVFLGEAQTQFSYLTKRFDDDRPDLVLYDPGAMAGQVLGRRYGIPAVSLSITPRAWLREDEEPDPRMMESLGSPDSAREYYERLRAWLAENGITEDPNELQTNPDGVLSLVPRVLQPGAEQAPEYVRFAGPCLAPERLADRSWTPPGSGKPVVLMSLGNTWNDRPDFYRSCLRAFTGSGWHVVLVLGKYAHSPEFQVESDDIEIRERVPQLAVLEHAAVFVTHAGAGGCVEAMWYGVPTVAVPQGIEQFDSAERLVALGVGRHLPHAQVTPETLRDAVGEMIADKEAASRLAKISAEVQASGGVAGAADAVESFARR